MSQENIWQSCPVQGCLDPVVAKGLCNVHYVRAKRGTPLTRPWDVPVEGPKCAPITVRRDAIYRWQLSEECITEEPNTGCFLWTGTLDPSGYGRIGSESSPWGGYAHRAALYFAGVKLEGGRDKCVRHTCDQPSCVNPAHLRFGTSKENAGDRTARAARDPAFKERYVTRMRAARARNNPRPSWWDSRRPQMLELKAAGLTLRQIAQQIGISEGSVCWTIYRKPAAAP